MTKKFQVGIVGFGGAGMAQYDIFQKLHNSEVTAIFDPKEAGRSRARKINKNIIITSDFKQLLSLNIDIISICSPDKTHADYICMAQQAGKHVLCEKPLTDSLLGCKKILKSVNNNPHLTMAVQHQMRFVPLFTAMKKIVQSKALGNIFYAEGYYVHNLTERAGRFDDWRFKDKALPVIYCGCHFIDLLRWLLNDEVVEVMAMANNMAFPKYPIADFDVTLLRFKSGTIGKVITAFGAGRPQDHSVRIYGDDKSIENNLLFEKNGAFEVIHRPFPQIVLDADFKPRESLGKAYSLIKPIILSYLCELLIKMLPRSGDYALGTYPLRLYEHRFAVKESIKNFLWAVETGKEPRCTALDSAKTIAVAIAGAQSYQNHKIVKVANL